MSENLPYSIQVLLESATRHFDGQMITQQHIDRLSYWQPKGERKNEIPFMPARIILQDYTGVPLLADMAALRDFMKESGLDPSLIEPAIPVDFIIDHSLQTNHTGSKDALYLNQHEEFLRNRERYSFIKWSAHAFKKLNVFPPGLGIVHQLNMEFLAKGVLRKVNTLYPDSVIGTDSHTTMINGLGIVGWGVGGIEAEAAMLGLPVFIHEPDVIGVNLCGQRQIGVTATDIVLYITHVLREMNLPNVILEFFGEAVDSFSVQDRCTIANMAPEYGATMALFYVDDKTLDYYRITGRSESEIADIFWYYKANNWYKRDGLSIDYTEIIKIDISCVKSCVAGPRLPSQYIELNSVSKTFQSTYMSAQVIRDQLIKDGDILIAAITSCANTANTEAMVTAGLLAKKAVAKGLTVSNRIKTSITPGSLVVADYLVQLGLQESLNKLGFNVVGYGCATCSGGVGNLEYDIEYFLDVNDIIACSVLSGNRNFESRIHPKIKANFLMSPALVIAYAIAGNIHVKLDIDSLGEDQDGQQVYLSDIWPAQHEIQVAVMSVQKFNCYERTYKNFNNYIAKEWKNIKINKEEVYSWDKDSTYIARPPFVTLTENCLGDVIAARALLVLGDSITTDHISPAGKISENSDAGRYLLAQGVSVNNFNNFGARRGNHEVMVRGAFSNALLENKIIDRLGGYTVAQPCGVIDTVYQVSKYYTESDTPLLIFAGKNYGIGSSRDWAAKATTLLGVKVVIAESFERIHKSNLIGMGILPCQLPEERSVASLKLKGNEYFDLFNIESVIMNNTGKIHLIIYRDYAVVDEIELACCLDSSVEKKYYQSGGILPYLLRRLSVKSASEHNSDKILC